MSPTQSATNSLTLVHTELEATIQEAETSLTTFLENRNNGESIQNCIDCLNQLRGIFVLLDIQGCALLCQESVALANAVPLGAADDKNDLLASLSNAIFVLRRYTEFFQFEGRDQPELLLPLINDLRKALGEKSYQESHFFECASEADFADLVDIDESRDMQDVELYARRFRQIYQLGLIEVLQDKNHIFGLKLIAHASEGARNLCKDMPMASFWALLMIATNVVRSQHMVISSIRKRLFMRIERYFRELSTAGIAVASKNPPESLIKDLLYIIAISGSEDARSKAVVDRVTIEVEPVPEKSLVEYKSRLFGPGVDVLRSLSAAMREEFLKLKEILAQIEPGMPVQSEQTQLLNTAFTQISGCLVMLELGNLEDLCRQQVAQVSRWESDMVNITENSLMSVADNILCLEAAVKHFEDTGEKVDLQTAEELIWASGKTHLDQAVQVVLLESKNALALIKTSVTAYLDSGDAAIDRDRLHLVNVSGLFDAIIGSMGFIDQDRLLHVLERTRKCFETKLLNDATGASGRFMNAFADILSSLEFYFDSMGYGGSANEEFIKLAEESLESVGFA